MLRVSELNVYYDAIHALKDVTFEVHEGEIVSLIGANGAGKTTTLRSISGLLGRGGEGQILFQGKNIEMTVLENLEMGAYARKDRAQLGEEMERVFTSFPRLKERRRQLAGTLSGGEQQMLAMGRALMSSPKLLMMDEPSMGLSPILVAEIFSIIKNINQQGVTVLLVEQNARMALSIADRAYVMETGKIVMQGPARELLGNEDVKRAYLGT